MYSYNVILQGKLMEWTTDTCNNMGDSYTHYAKWNKVDAQKDHCVILCIKTSKTRKNNL